MKQLPLTLTAIVSFCSRKKNRLKERDRMRCTTDATTRRSSLLLCSCVRLKEQFCSLVPHALHVRRGREKLNIFSLESVLVFD